ncbi:YmfQ family protein [Pseudoduganella sp. RAF53_2]|uniref:YmfQ family protein n=1 Tax=unclassified Pseudoduganella TaxID=2637179 RepID=UPI003F9B42A6
MAAPLYSAADYLGALQALMPRGRVWPRDPGAVQTKVLAGLSASYAAQNARSNYLLQDAFPQTANELLPEWEATLGLPSPVIGPAPSILARQTLVVARLVGPGGLTIPTLTRFSGLLGYAVEIRGGAPFRCGQSKCGQQLGTVEQMYRLTVTAPAAAATPFGAYGPAVLQNELNRLIPPYAVLTFQFK